MTSQNQHRHRRTHTVAPLAALYGPNTDQVLRFLEDLRRPGMWTQARIRRCGTRTGSRLRHAAARRATRRATRGLEDREAQRAAALNRAWDETATHEETSERCGWAAGWAAAALTVQDLIQPKHLLTLTEPFADLMLRYATTKPGGPLPTSSLPAPTATTRHGENPMATTASTPNASSLRAYRKLTQSELTAEARARFGENPRDIAFQCPRCGDIAVAGDFPKGEEARLGQECVGRWRGALQGPANDNAGQDAAARGCDWTAYGLFKGPWEIVMPDGHSAWGFPLAPANPVMKGMTVRVTAATCQPATATPSSPGGTSAATDDAERRMQRDAEAVNQAFRVAGVLHGAPECADRYTKYVDPADSRNLDDEGLIPDSDELQVTEWTVMGLLLDPRDPAWNRRTGGRRYLELVDALSPLAAEDVARSRAGDQGAQLVVCAVFRGRVQRADPHAVFSDPDLRATENAAGV